MWLKQKELEEKIQNLKQEIEQKQYKKDNLKQNKEKFEKELNEKVKDIIENGKLNTLPEELDAQIVAIIERIDKAEAEAMK